MRILQLRARSKAAEAGLMDGDEILAINGYSCKDVSFDRLNGLVEHAGHYLDLDIIRYFYCMYLLHSSSDYFHYRSYMIGNLSSSSSSSFITQEAAQNRPT